TPANYDVDMLTFKGGTLVSTADFDIDDTNRGITLDVEGGTFEVGSGTTLTLFPSNLITGPGGLTKTGAGTLVLRGKNDYSGGTTISGGTLALSGGGLLKSTGAVNLAAAAAIFDISAISANFSVNTTGAT